MNISSEITQHIEQRAEAKAITHAAAIVLLLSEEVRLAGGITVVSPDGGTVAITEQWVDNLRVALIQAARERLTKEETDTFIASAEKIIAAKTPKTEKPKAEKPEEPAK